METVFDIAILFAQILCLQGKIFLPAPILNGLAGEQNNICPTSESLATARENLKNSASSALSVLVLKPECGDGLWSQVVSLDMTDSSQQCPSPWVEYSNPVRSCSRPSNAGATCRLVSYPVLSRSYQRVCGRIRAYSVRTPDGFANFSGRSLENYVDGVSLAYSAERKHIWAFAAGAHCPCNTGTNYPQPSFVPSDQFFCNSRVSNVALWDGDCTQTQSPECCQLNSPPWFSVQLPDATTDAIDVRLCGDQAPADEDVNIQQIEIYVQ